MVTQKLEEKVQQHDEVVELSQYWLQEPIEGTNLANTCP